MARPFKTSRPLYPRRSVFNLSYDKKFTGDMGELYPVMCDEVVPGDRFNINAECVLRMQPLVAPILHEINMYVHYFFVPYRLLWSDWETFITGGVNGDQEPTLPRYVPTTADKVAKGTLWDYFGFPTGVLTPSSNSPLAFPWYAYNLVWNEYYRDETLQDERLLSTNSIGFRNWSKDYFTSALPFQQRGAQTEVPVFAEDPNIYVDSSSETTNQGDVFSNMPGTSFVSDAFDPYINVKGSNNAPGTGYHLKANMETISTFSVTQLRLAFQVQRWLERNARSGARYTEFLHAHFGVSPRDDRLNRPEYIGGMRAPVIISEVLQTSSTDTTSPQGNMSGKGMAVNRQYIGTYTASEYGLILGVMSIMPVPAYQQGINRQWLRQTKYDFFFPEFANLSEQPVTQNEIYTTAVQSSNDTLFGYQGRYDEMRYKPNLVCSSMRDTFAYWHVGRIFSSAPLLNSDFIKCVPRKDIFAVPSEDGFIIDFGNVIKAIRPIPIASQPGLIDHD